jgi:hypothetical protein
VSKIAHDHTNTRDRFVSKMMRTAPEAKPWSHRRIQDGESARDSHLVVVELSLMHSQEFLIASKPYCEFESLSLRHAVWTAEKTLP